ncbi:hypothetical protein [Thioclava sp. GXIMD4215]|uniref:hypothetical protein n=1 Tax=Thioclava sp. GXIMD4215 TaxID=3131928 RepID=UPI00311AEC2E
MKLTLTSSSRNPSEPICKRSFSRSSTKPPAYLFSKTINVKEPKTKITSSTQSSGANRQPNLPNFYRFNRFKPSLSIPSAAASAPRCVVCRCGEAVFTENTHNPQPLFSQKHAKNQKNQLTN